MNTQQQRSAALGLLAELVPAGVMSRAHQLASEIEQDEYVRAYLARHAAGIIVFGLAAMILSTAATVLLLGYIFRELAPVASWMKLPIAAAGLALWFSGVLVPLYFRLTSLRRAALRERDREQSR